MAVRKAAAPVFYSRTCLPPRPVTPAGNPIMTTYQEVVDKETGHKSIVPSGSTNLYDRIQANLEETKLENIIRRATLGDPTALSVVEGEYMDVTDFPASLAEAQNLILRTKQHFERLPLEIREKFGHSAERYVAEFGSQAWLDAIGYKPDPDPAPAPEGGPTE